MDDERSATEHPPRLWYIAFLPAQMRHWWNHVCLGPWKHVAAFTFDPDLNRWLVFQFGPEGVCVEHLARGKMVERVALWHAGPVEILAIEEGDAMPWWRNFPLTCVGLAKALVRRGGGALYPGALYRILLSEGAERAWEMRHEGAEARQGTGGAAEEGCGAGDRGPHLVAAEAPAWADQPHAA